MGSKQLIEIRANLLEYSIHILFRIDNTESLLLYFGHRAERATRPFLKIIAS